MRCEGRGWVAAPTLSAEERLREESPEVLDHLVQCAPWSDWCLDLLLRVRRGRDLSGGQLSAIRQMMETMSKK